MRSDECTVILFLSIRLQSSYQTTAVAKAQNLIKVGLFVDWFFVFDRFVEGISLKENYKHKNGKEFCLFCFWFSILCSTFYL